MTVQHSLAISNLYLKDLPTDRRQYVESEVQTLTKLLDQIEIEKDATLNVVLTHDMGSHVNRINESYGKTLLPYTPIKNTMGAQGITIVHPHATPLHTSVILDQSAWIKDDNQSVVVRAYTLLHELRHVQQHTQGDGENCEHSELLPTTYEEGVCHESRTLWNEFDADILADKVCRNTFQLPGDDKPIGPGDFLVTGFIESAAKLLDSICHFVERDVYSYRYNNGKLNHLYPTAVMLIRELLTVLAHTAALCIVGMQMATEIVSILKRLRGFNEYIEDDWQAFFDALTEKYSPAVESELARILKVIMKRMGLVIEDLPDGQQFVHVFEPVFCCTPSQ